MLNQGDPINYFVKGISMAPNPAPGVVTEMTGDNDYTVQIELADDSTMIEGHVGEAGPDYEQPRWIELRDYVGFEPPVIEDVI